MLLSVVVPMLAGLFTVLGAVLVKRVRNTALGAFSLAFATGIMLVLSLFELLPNSIENLGVPFALALCASGVFFTLLLDLIVPHHHEYEVEKSAGHYINDCECVHEKSVSHSMIAALILHNVLEGIATGATVISDIGLGINMALGIAIHNIPIGTTLAVSVLSSGRRRSDALVAALLVGLSQPLGALAVALLPNILTGNVFCSICNATVSGILIFIAFDELWPAARKGGSRNLTIIALVAGICFVPLTELLV